MNSRLERRRRSSSFASAAPGTHAFWRFEQPLRPKDRANVLVVTVSPDVRALQGVPLFRSLSPQEVGFIARVSDRVTVPAGTTLMRQGESGAEFIVVLAGTAEVRRDGKLIATLGPGGFAGESSPCWTRDRARPPSPPPTTSMPSCSGPASSGAC